MDRKLPFAPEALLTIAWLFLHLQSALCQFEKNFTPYRFEDTTLRQQHVLKLDDDLKANLASISGSDKDIKNDFREVYQDRHDLLVWLLRKDYFLLDDQFAPFFSSILDEILRANPGIDKSLRLFVHKTSIPNAAYIGNGIFLFNLGMISRLENESQIAFILCHELAHHTENHLGKRIDKTIAIRNSKETQQQIKQAVKSEYKTYSKLKGVLEKYSFDIRRHGRDNESEADSVALVYLMNTKYDAREGIRALSILDSVDNEKYDEIIDLKKMFNTQQYPFKDSWLAYEKSGMWHVSPEDRENADSLKTHPDCQERVAAAKRILEAARYTGAGKSKFVQSEKKFSELRERADFEIIESLYEETQIDLALYLSLEMLNKYPENIYLHSMIGKCFYRMHTAQQNRELGKIVSLPDPRLEESLDRLLTFIEQLRLSDLSNLGYHYLKKYDSEDENYLHALYLCSKTNGNAEDINRTKEKYAALYPEGKFKKDFEESVGNTPSNQQRQK